MVPNNKIKKPRLVTLLILTELKIKTISFSPIICHYRRGWILRLSRSRIFPRNVFNVSGCGGCCGFAKASKWYACRKQFINFFQASPFHLWNDEVGHDDHQHVDGTVDKTNLGPQCCIRRVKQIRNRERGYKCGNDRDNRSQEVRLFLHARRGCFRYHDV